MKHYKYISIFILALVFSTQVSAESATGTRALNNREENRAMMQDKIMKRKEMGSTTRAEIKNASTTEEKCGLIEQKIGERTVNFEKRHEDVAGRFEDIKKKLTDVVTLLKQEGKDTTDLEAALKTLGAKIVAINSDAVTVNNKLKETENYACGKSEGKFKQAIKDAGEARKEVIGGLKDAKDFINKEVRPAVQKVRGEKKPSATSTN